MFGPGRSVRKKNHKNRQSKKPSRRRQDFWASTQRSTLIELLEPRILLVDDLHVTRLSPLGPAGRPFDRLELLFSKPVDDSTFALSAVSVRGSVSGPAVPLAPKGLTRMAADRYEIDLTGLTGLGTYSLIVGPNIRDSAGQQPMNQDHDATAGEPADDAYNAALFAAGATISATNSTYDGQALVIVGSTATIDGTHAFGAIEVLGGAVVTHSATTASDEFKIDWQVTDGLWIDATSKIDVSGRGYMSGYTLGNTTAGGAKGWSAGTYGGYGYSYSGATNPTYGDYRDPNELGSGGYNSNHGNPGPGSAGAGGGLVRITAAAAVIDGVVRASGNTGWGWDGWGGGGSGGGICLNVGTLAGVGTIEANGGNTNSGPAGGGGGGRVAVYSDDMTQFTTANVTANAGHGGNSSGGVGTVYLKNKTGEGVLRLDSHGTATGVWTPLGIAADAQFAVDRLVIAGAGVVAAPEHQMPIQANNVGIQQGAVLTTRATDAAQEYSLLLTIAQGLTVDGTSAIDVSAKGYMANYTLGNTTTGGATSWASGAYGGYGNTTHGGATNAVYGDYRNPNELGSGGSNHHHRDPGPGSRGAGGGLVRITASAATVDGAIRADGAGGWNWDGWGGAGSGGGIWLNVSTLAGTGVIAANGGTGTAWNGGGGGRVAVVFDDMTQFDAAKVTALAGAGGDGPGAVGTVYLKDNTGEGVLRLDSRGTPAGAWTPLGIATDAQFNADRLVIAGAGVVAAPEHQMPIQANNVGIQQGAVLTTRATDAAQEYSLLMTVTQGLTVDMTSAIDVSSKGYMAGYTSGNTMTGGATIWASGTYGGYGNTSRGGATNAAYGDYRNPNELGSGGSNRYHPDAGPNGLGTGGGLVRITAATAIIDGAIRADGAGGWNRDGWGGGGSGGGIWLSVSALAGSGAIEADGGSSGWNGGGGGRVAVYFDNMSQFTAANVTANAGAGDDSGGVGTVYLKNNSGEGVLRIDGHGRPAGAWTPLGVKGDALFNVDHLVISGAGVVAVPEHQMPIQANNVDVQQGAVLTTRATDASQVYSLLMTIAQALTVDASSAIDVSGKGYMSGYTAGNKTVGGATGWMAGSYGGMGAGSEVRMYDVPDYPNHPGSGGYNHYHGNPGPGGLGTGGGLVHITAATAAIDGAIRASGNAGWNWDGWGGAGSGGGILLNVGALSGAGLIQANGGTTSGGPGGGGGGGRIAVHNWTPNGVTLPAANITASGGNGGGGAGRPGTAVLSQTPNYYWNTPDTLFHGAESLAWETLGLDPTKIAADLTAYNGPQAYPIAVNRPCTGSLQWDTTAVPDGAYEIRVVFHDAFGQELGRITRAVGVNNAAAWHSGSISSDALWTKDQVHIVEDVVTVASGAGLTIESGAVVKFLPGADLQLIVQNGGALRALATQNLAIVLTSLADDSAGGDTGFDGAQTTPHAGDWHGLLVLPGGTKDLSQYVQQRYSLLTVACVQWQGGLSHETINGSPLLLAAVVKNDQYPITYTWDFGDGSPLQSGTAASQTEAYNIETTHVYPDSGPGTPYVATLAVTDPSGNSSSCPYPVVVRGDSLNVRRDMAIEKGLWWLHKQIKRSGVSGYWTEGGYSISLTGSTVLAFENNGHLPNGDPSKDPYAEDVTRGLNYLLSQMVAQPISQDPASCPYGDPDTNGNGIGVTVNSGRSTYEIGPAMMALAASTTPEAVAQAGPADVNGRTYREILTDMVDLCAWGQTDTGSGRGGWRYTWNSGDSDNSVTQWPALGIEAAEANWGITPPEFVKRELELWLTRSQDGTGGWGYAGADGANNFSHAGAAVAGLGYCGLTPADSRIQRGLAWMNANWNASTWGGTIWDNKYAMYAMAKGLRTINPAITMVGTHDWYAEFSESLIGTQGADGKWPVTSPWTSGLTLDTAFSILVLEPTVLSRPPIAVMQASPLGAQPEARFTFDGSNSYHLDSTRKIVEYAFDFGDGTTYAETAANAPDGLFDGRTTHVYPDTVEQIRGMPNQRRDYAVTMIVRDDDPRGAKTDQAHQTVTLSLVNHAPVSDPGGPYVAYVGLPLTLSGIGSYDPDAGGPLYNHIAAYGWQLTSAAPYAFADAATMTTNWTWNAPGAYHVGLKVTDRFGASTIAWTSVEVRTGVPTNIFVRAKGEYQTVIDVTARLTTPTESPVAGVPLDFYVDFNRDNSFDPVAEFVGEATTGADGWAFLPHPQRGPAGDYGLEVRFAGQGDYFASRLVGVLSAPAARTAVVYTGDTSGKAGQAVQLRATLHHFQGDPIAGGAIAFALGSQTATAQTDAQGVATASVILDRAAGADAVRATFGGDANYKRSSDATPFAARRNDTPPSLAPMADQAVDEGQTATLNGSFTDPDPGQVHLVTVDWGDGSPAVTIPLPQGQFTFSSSHDFLEEGSYLATVTVQDDDGSDTKAFLVNVADVAVVVTGGFVIPALKGRPFSNLTVATFVDPGGAEPKPADPDPVLEHHYLATVDWGDTSISTGLITFSGGVFTVQGSHVYNSEGTYLVRVIVQHETAPNATAASTAIVKAAVGILLLDPKSSGALKVSDYGSVVVNNSGVIVVDSTSRQAAVIQCRGAVTVTGLDVAGGVCRSKLAKLNAQVYTKPPVADPLALPLPAAPAETYSAVRHAKRDPLTLNPGTYVGGITISGGGTVTMNPGIYYMQGGGFRVTRGSSVKGTGVLVINAPRKSSDRIQFDDTTSVGLTPPPSLPGTWARYAGIALFQDPASNVPIMVSDCAAVTVEGVIYAPKATMKIVCGGPRLRNSLAGAVVNSWPARALDPQMILYGLQVTGKGSIIVNAATSVNSAPGWTSRNTSALSNTRPALMGPFAAVSPGRAVVALGPASPTVTVDRLITGNSRPTLTGTAVPASPTAPITAVSVALASQTFPATLNGSTWSAVVPASLADRTYDVRVTALDAAGHTTGDATADELTVDTIAAAPTIRNIVSREGMAILSGMVIEPSPSSGIAGVTVVIAGQNLTATLDGRLWNARLPTPLPDGRYAVVATATDMAGNSASNPADSPAFAMAHTATVDTAKPVTTVARLTTDSTRPVLRGTLSDPTPGSGITGVTVRVGGQDLVATISGGTWTAVPRDALADGIYDVRATAVDSAGNIGADATADELTVYTGKPLVTVDPLVSNTRQPVLSGTVKSRDPRIGIAAVQVLVGGQTFLAAVTGEAWHVVPDPLADGVYDVRATAIDVAGNQTTDSTANELIVDAAGPVVTVDLLATNNPNATLTGTVSDPSPGSGIAGVTVFLGGQTMTATVTGNTWSVALPAVLADGTYDVQATASDLAGNIAVDASTGELAIDTARPQVTADTRTTNSSQPMLSGTVTDAAPSSGIASVRVTVGGQTFFATRAGATWGATVPGPLADGTYSIEVTATDNAGNSTTGTTLNGLTVDTVQPEVTVQPQVANQPKPTLTGAVIDPAPGSGVASVSVVVAGQTLSATVTGNAWSVAVPLALADGTYNVQVTARDKAGNAAGDATDGELTVDTAAPTVTVNSLVTTVTAPTLTGTVSDPSPSSGLVGVTVVVAGQTIPAALAGNAWTAAVPVALAEGVYDVQVTAADRAGNTTADATTNELTIGRVAPVLNPIPNQTVVEGKTLRVTAVAHDPVVPPVTLTFSLDVAPAGASIDPATGVFTWMPTSSPQDVNVTIRVSDDGVPPLSAAQSFRITVTAPRPPIITSTPPTRVTAGTAYVYNVVAMDPDGYPLTYALVSAPQGMTIDASSGAVAWLPGKGDVGDLAVDVRVSDSRGLFVDQSYTLTVMADTQAPQVTVNLSKNPVDIGATVTVTVSATDNVAVTSLALTVDGAPVALDGSGKATLQATEAGRMAVVGSASDPSDNLGTSQAFLVVRDPNDHTPPVVAITLPAAGSMITAPVQVIGTAHDPSLVGYEVDVKPVSGGAWQTAFAGAQDVVNGVLGTFDPTLLPNDSYILSLTATDANGNTASAATTLEVVGSLKLGNFRLSFTDLSVPVSGIPITVTRTYDTMDIGSAREFGPGWSLEFRSTNLRTNVPWTGVPSPGTYPPFFEGTRVYVTLPGGKREGFTFRPTGPAWPFSLYQPAFTADAGVTSTLTVGGVNLTLDVDGSYYTFPDGAPYNPADTSIGPGTYTLTTKDGTQYVIDGNSFKLNTVTDRNGNKLTFTDTAITSSAGPKVTFTRDGQGRITSVTDPIGKQLLYGYDAKGDLVSVTDREGNVTQFVYDAAPAHYLSKIIDPLGRTGARMEYDDQGRLVRTFDVASNAVTIAYDPANSLETIVDALGNPTTFEYDTHGNVVMELNALGGTTRRTFDVNDNMLSETDPLGQTWSYTYDGKRNKLTETDPLGKTTTWTYNAFGQVLTRSDPLGNTSTNVYDSRGNLLTATDAAGNPTIFTYDGAGNQTSATDAMGGIQRFERNARGDLVRQLDALGNEMTFTYDTAGNQLTCSRAVTTPQGPRILVNTTEYNANGWPVTVTDAENQTTRTEYDRLGRQSATIDALGRRTQYTYDERGQLVTTAFADGTSTHSDCDAMGRQIASTDGQGRLTRYELDALGRVTVTIHPDGTPGDDTDNPRTRTEYDAAGRMTARIDERGNRTEFEYDRAGHPALVRDPLGNVTLCEYDGAGRQVAVTDALGHATRFAYNSLSQLTDTIFADGTKKTTAYDALGNVTARTDQAGRVARFEYDRLGRLTAVVDALNQRTEYEYDEAGNLVVRRDANRHETRMEYDGVGRQIATVLPMGQRSTTTYDAAGNVASTTDFNGDAITYTYDARDRLLAKQYPDGRSVVYTYTPTGRRASAADSRGVTAYTYDPRDRLLSRTDPDGRQIAYSYDAAGNETSISVPSGATTYTYDAMNRMATATGPDGAVTEYTYDAAGRLVETHLPNGAVETRRYDALDRLTFVGATAPGGAVVDSFTYTLDADGNRTRVVEAAGRQVDYVYDALNRLLEERITDSVAGNRTFDYTHDPVGNRLTRTDSLEGLTSYGYDDNDRLLTETLAGDVTRYTYDDNGNMLTKITSAADKVFYAWDYDNRLVAADTNGDGAPDVADKYDADGNRVSQTAAGEEIRFLIDANGRLAQVMEEYSPGGIVKVSYVYGDRLIAQNRGGAKSFYHADALGSTRALTDALGLVTDRYVYDAFGRALLQSGLTPNLHLFAGERWDPGVGLFYLRARYYDPQTGRFASMDRFPGFTDDPLSLNKYLYAHANPVRNLDPSGQSIAGAVVITMGIMLVVWFVVLQPIRGLPGYQRLSGMMGSAEGAEVGQLVDRFGKEAWYKALEGQGGNCSAVETNVREHLVRAYEWKDLDFLRLDLYGKTDASYHHAVGVRTKNHGGEPLAVIDPIKAADPIVPGVPGGQPKTGPLKANVIDPYSVWYCHDRTTVYGERVTITMKNLTKWQEQIT